RKWAVDSNEYRRRLGSLSSDGGPPRTGAHRARLESCGVTWNDGAVDLTLMPATNPDRARLRFRAALPELIWNTAALEGSTFTLPEVRTLLEGVTVGGRPLQETEQILALRDAYHRLDEHLARGTFALKKSISDELQGLLARHEAIEVGNFRGEGSVTGGGHVRLSTGERVEGVDHGLAGSDLIDRYEALLDYLDHHIQDPRAPALGYFAAV